MPFETLSTGRGPLLVCLAASVLALGLSGCGRRGPLEAPPDAAAPAAARQVAARPVPASPATLPQQGTLDTPDDETDEQEVVQNVVPTPAAPGSRKRNRGFTVPKEPFILDPLL